MTNAERLSSFLASLRGESTRGPGRGLRRLARLVRGGAGLATKVMAAGRAASREGDADDGKGSGAQPPLSAADLRRIESLVTQLGELKGLPMKFGQIMSYLELDLPEEMRGLLALLQTQAPATPFATVADTIRELGARAEPLLAGLERSPVSIASIGQVHRGRLPADGQPGAHRSPGAASAPLSVAVKVRHPGIEEAIRSDLAAASLGTGLAGALVPGMGATARDFVDEVRARLLEECDYGLEAQRQRRFGRLYAGHPVIVVPEVHDAWCGRSVLTTSWEDGLDFEAFRAQATQARRDAAGAALFDFYIGTLYRHGLFHADPHPGNYCFGADGRVVVFDFGCVRVFEPELARAFAALAEAVRTDERDRIHAALVGLGAAPARDDKAWAHTRRLLRSFFGPLLTPGPRRIEGRIVLDWRQATRDKLALARLRLPGRLMFLFRIRFGLFAVLSRLGAVCDWAALERGWAAQANVLSRDGVVLDPDRSLR